MVVFPLFSTESSFLVALFLPVLCVSITTYRLALHPTIGFVNRLLHSNFIRLNRFHTDVIFSLVPPQVKQPKNTTNFKVKCKYLLFCCDPKQHSLYSLPSTICKIVVWSTIIFQLHFYFYEISWSLRVKIRSNVTFETEVKKNNQSPSVCKDILIF